MELGVSHEQSLSSLTPIVDNTFDKYNKNLVPIRSLSDHDNTITKITFTIGTDWSMYKAERDTYKCTVYNFPI